MQNRFRKPVIIVAVAALTLAVIPRFVGKAKAAIDPQFDTVAVRLNTLVAQAYSGGTVCIATPASTGSITGFGTENFVDVGFPDQSGIANGTEDFQVQTTTLNNWTTDTTGIASPVGNHYWPTINISGTPVTPAAWPTIGLHAVAATNTAYTAGNPNTLKVVRFATGNLIANKVYCFDFKSGANDPAAETSGSFALQNSKVGSTGYQEDVPGYVKTINCTASCTSITAYTGTEIERSNWGTQIVPNNTIVISAVVPPILEIDFNSGNTDTFPVNLDPNSVKTTTGNTFQVKTNAKGGWFIWTKSKNQALTSAASGGSIPSVGFNAGNFQALVAGTPGYNLTVGVAGNVNGAGTTKCTPQAETEYAGNVTLFQGGQLTSYYEMTADCSTTTPPGTDGGTNITYNENAAINFSTPASADYTDTLFVTGAGQF
jgi:hypothetical protein